ncbi:hypothetical protein RMR21_001950 [Agrobacterium sp. rho-8.1]|nr:hypothetical protein [Agrobacterium sp. rho-8.1]
MSGALAKYLKDFSQFVPPETPSHFYVDTPVSAFENDVFAEPEIIVDLDEEKRKAFAEGEVAATQQAKDTHEKELEALRTSHAQEIEAMRTRYEEEIATHLAMSVISMKQTIAADVEQVCFRLFGMLMERDFAEKAATDVATQIIKEIEGGHAGTIKITGPDLIVSRVREALGDVDNQVDYDVSTDIDVKVQMENSVLMTRLSEFFQSVRGLADE